MSSQAESTYTVTIGLFCRRTAVLSLVERYSGEEIMLFKRRQEDQTCFFVCIGTFDSREAAEAYMAGLDETIKRQKPSVYRLDSFIP